MSERVIAEVFPPGEFIKEELEARGWTQADLAEVLGTYPRLVNEIILGKRSITRETAKSLGDALGTDPQLWMNLEAAFQLSKLQGRDVAIAQRAKLYEVAPIREMIRRHWIEPSNNVEVLEKQVLNFLGIHSLDEDPIPWPYAARKSAAYASQTSAQRAWLFRARHLARALDANPFENGSLEKALQGIKPLLHNPEETRHIPRVLAEAGIRFLVMEPLPRTRIDGATFWLDKTSPVIVLSLRFDRIDYFWFTVPHELDHVGKRNVSLDTNLVGDDAKPTKEKPQNEQEADAFAEEFLVPKTEIEGFIARVRPLYSSQKIIGFANRIGVHPGIVVGQLQHRGELSWAHNRKLLAPVRHIITTTALTDGWGHVLPSIIDKEN